MNQFFTTCLFFLFLVASTVLSSTLTAQGLSARAISTGVHFDGIEDYAQLDKRLASELSGRDQLTLEIRLSFESLTSYRGIFAFREYYGQHNSYIFELQTSGYGGKYFSTNVSNGEEDFRMATGTPIKTKREYLVTVVFDGTQANPTNRTKMYINGVGQALTGGEHAPATTPDLGEEVPIYLAREGNRLTNVTIYEVRIWSTARSAAEVAATSASKLADTQANGLLAHYDLTAAYGVDTETGIPTLADRAGNGYHASLYNLDQTAGTGQTAGSEPIIVLPVDLIGFNAEASAAGNLLDWTVMAEEDLSHYTIERSADGSSFWYAIGEQPAEGTVAGEKLTYHFTDRTSGESAYYRLRMVDLDGSFEVSDMVHVASGKMNPISVYPNPVTDHFTVEAASREALNLELRDLTGRLVWRGEVSAGTGRHTQITSGFDAGIYLLTARSARDSWTRRLVIR